VKADKENVPKPTRDELSEYFPRDQKIGELRREANDLAKLQRGTESKSLAYVRENGGAEKVAIVCGYRLMIETVNEAVKWEESFLDELAKHIGAEKAAKRAEEIRKAAGKKDKIKIEPPAA
jgi:hypothetical protein